MAPDIVWEKSIRSALGLARTGNKLVLAVFLSTSCEACMRMVNGTLITDRVQEYIRDHFIAIRYESGLDSDQFARFCVSAKPAMIVLDDAGNEIFRKIGYFEPDLFIEKLEKARKKASHRATSHRAA